MVVVNGINDIKLKRSIVVLGKFDGFHLGHRHLLLSAAGLKKDGSDLVLFTFDIFPGMVLNKNSVKILDPDDNRAVMHDPDCLKYVDYIIEFPFNRQTMEMPASDFVKNILVEKLGARYIAAGTDFRFGKDRKGDTDLLKELGKVYGFDVLVVDKVTALLPGHEEEREISSTLIKDEILKGHMENAAMMLGRPYSIAGRIVHGRHVGTSLGFPTANLPIPEGIVIPPNGVYATKTDIEDEGCFESMTNIGIRPTLNDGENASIETNIFDFEKNIYNVSGTVSFFNKTNGIYSYIFQVLEHKIDNQIVYFVIYIYFGEEGGYNLAVKKFKFSKFDFESVVEIKPEEISRVGNNRITSSIIVDFYKLLIVFYLDSYCNAVFYDYNLQVIDRQNNIFSFSNSNDGLGLFFKSIYLSENYVAFFHFYNSYNFLFRICKIMENYSFDGCKIYTNNKVSLLSHPTMNELLKISNDRFVLVSLSYEYPYTLLYIIFFDLYNNYAFIKVRYYKCNFKSNKISLFNNEISAFIYNDFLVFTGTYTPFVVQSSQEIYSILLMFGYPNGTDSEIDISYYLIDSENYDESYNLYNYLMTKMKIDNNIFHYEKVEQIKLISIPDEIIFLNKIDNSSISNNYTIDVNYILKQNDTILKNNSYYFLDYQFMVKELDYSSFYSNIDSHMIIDDTLDLSQYFVPKILYGRTNTLKFKLCHKYCKTCRKIGISDNNQKCESCLEEYSFFNNDDIQNNQELKCIPQGYFYDEESHSLIECTPENSKFYVNITNNRTICIKDDKDCPIDYQNYDETTKECEYSKNNIFTTILEEEEISDLLSNNNQEQIDFSDNKSTNINPKISTTEINNKIETSQLFDSLSTNIHSDNIDNSTKIDSFIPTLNEEINKMIDTELLLNYTVGDKSYEIKGDNNTIFQLTTTDNELNRFLGNLLNENGLSIIDLGTCEITLKDYYKIDYNTSLIIKKFEQLTIASERNVQYEVYHPITKEKLNLSLCDSDTVDLYIPVELDEKLLELYEDLQNSGYDLFNIEDPFYNDICSPYKSENGTDVLLSDRKNDYYNNNYTTCQSNCEYSSFNSEYKFLKCECKVIVDDIDINDFDKFSKKIYKNFYDILKNSNYKTLKCYKLVFNFNYLKKNVGNFVVLGFFIGYICFFCIFIIKGISPLQEETIKIIFDKFNNVDIANLDKIIIDKNIINNINKKEKQKIIEFPPKKRRKILFLANN